MPRGYRLFGLAAFGWLSLAASPPSQGAGDKNPNGQQAYTSDLKRIAAALEKLSAAQAPDQGCEDGQDDRSSDLCAQWKAADSASASALWAENTFYLGIAGLVIGLFTLLAAASAAWYARNAWLETKRTADTADDGFRLAEKSARMQLRPYVFVKEIRFIASETGGASDARVALVVQNYGTTLAKDLRIDCGAAVGNPQTKSTKVNSVRRQNVQYFLPPSATVEISIPVGKISCEFISPDKRLFCSFIVCYKDDAGIDYANHETWLLPRDGDRTLFVYYSSP
jgi:hypothetical protein